MENGNIYIQFLFTFDENMFFLCDESKYSRNWGQSEAVLPSIHMITLIDFLFYIFLLLFSHFHLEIKFSTAFWLNRNFKIENLLCKN